MTDITDAAIQQAEQNADESWLELAKLELYARATRWDYLTADDITEAMLRDHPHVTTHEPRAMGAVFRHGQRVGWIRATRNYEQSRRPSKHQSPTRVWRSLIGPMSR